PDLGGDPAKLRFKGTPKLREFIHGLITQEFDGPEPSPAALDSIVAYVTAISPAACPRGAESAISLSSRLAAVASAVSLARTAYAKGDAATGRALLSAARSTLGAIDERFQVDGLDNARAELRSADAELFELQQAGASGPWVVWFHRWPIRQRVLRAA